MFLSDRTKAAPLASILRNYSKNAFDRWANSFSFVYNNGPTPIKASFSNTAMMLDRTFNTLA